MAIGGLDVLEKESERLVVWNCLVALSNDDDDDDDDGELIIRASADSLLAQKFG